MSTKKIFAFVLFVTIVSSGVYFGNQSRERKMAKKEQQRQEAAYAQATQEAQAAEQYASGVKYCAYLFNQLYAKYLPSGTISFKEPCAQEHDLWQYVKETKDAGALILKGDYSEANPLYLIIIKKGSHLGINGKSAVKQIDASDEYDRYLVLGGDFSLDYEAGFEPTPESTRAYIYVDVPNARYNSAGCMAYRALGGSSGLGGVNPSNPNDDPECNYPTHREKKYINP